LAQFLKEEIRKRIIESAIKEFREKGYDKASIKNISKGADVAVGNLYRYFENKEALLKEVVNPVFKELAQMINTENMLENIDYKSYIFDNLNRFLDLYIDNKTIFFIVIDGCKGTKTGYIIEDFIDMLADNINNLVNKFNTDSCINMYEFSHALAVAVVQGGISILRNSKDEDVKNNFFQYISFLMNDFAERINKI
jgi:AcrR family transcriptional regulator